MKIWVAGLNIFVHICDFIKKALQAVLCFESFNVNIKISALFLSIPFLYNTPWKDCCTAFRSFCEKECAHRQLASHFDGGWFSDLVSAHHQMAFLEAPENTEQTYAMFAGGVFMPSACDLV